MTLQKLIIVSNKNGIHARPATIIAKEAQKFSVDITISYDSKHASAKSIMSLLSLGMQHGAEVELTVSPGNQSEEALTSIRELLMTDFTCHDK